jgi:hypothetical protein
MEQIMSLFQSVHEERKYSLYLIDHLFEANYPGIQDSEIVIKHFEDSAFSIPSEAQKFVGEDLHKQINDIMERLRILNNQYAGERLSTVMLYLNGNATKAQLFEDLKEWGKSYVDYRIKKPNSKDRGSPLVTYLRLGKEICHLFNCNQHISRSIMLLFRNIIVDYMLWYLYTAIMKTCITFIKNNGHNSVRYDDGEVRYVSSELYNFLVMLDINKEHYLFSYISSIYDRISIPDSIITLSTDDKLYKLSQLTSNIAEMKQQIIRGYKPHKWSIDFNGITIMWDWECVLNLGMIWVSKSGTNSSSSYSIDLEPASLSVRHDGILCNSQLPWITTKTPPQNDDFDYLSVNLFLIDKIHDRLLDCYLKVDHDAVNRRKPRNEIPAATNLTENCGSISVNSPDDYNPQPKKKKARLRFKRSVRSSVLFNAMEKGCGCKVENAKGSEKKVISPEGRVCKLKHHKRNHPIHSRNIGMMFGQLQFGEDEYRKLLDRLED